MMQTRSVAAATSERNTASSDAAMTRITSNGFGAANSTIPATQLAFNTSHIVILEELLTMRRTLEGISRRQEANDETVKASEMRMQELQPMPKRLDDIGSELNNHYSLAEERIRKQEADLRTLADKLVRSDEERLDLARKVEQISTKIALQATQADTQDLVSTRIATKRKEEDVRLGSESDKQPMPHAVFSDGSCIAVSPLPTRAHKRLKAESLKVSKKKISNFKKYVQASKSSYRKAPPKNGSDMKRFINHFLENIEDQTISGRLQKSILQRFQSIVRESKWLKGPRSIVIEGNLHWDEVCQLLDSVSFSEDNDDEEDSRSLS
ncbi:hypothetical protein LX32DRAFT_710587 [Colletotrichum zoysiae]|uniref:Uncharacterized protein n=1 Tax=Colletotrichum zoysiae TaxID=1216348 RepID=A0AAD9H5Q3_9PEZI|nr:hypothetical protein LX32DRAFT_710587 [Colletotrichum zoysiae]